MRIFILGSNVGLNKEQSIYFSTFCQDLGQELANHSIDLILCSPFEDSADRNVFDGVVKADKIKLKIQLHYPKHSETQNKWADLISQNLILRGIITDLKHPFEADVDESLTFSWLYSQIQALDNCDVVIVVGGKINGSANLLLRLAEAKDKDIVPIHFFEGLALYTFHRNYYKLLDTWGKDLPLLEGRNMQPLLVKSIITEHMGQKKSSMHIINPVFFLSYPRLRPEEADFVEMQLRRRDLTVIRDENDINESVDISNAIQESIHKANVFIALWCKEYACSPWCFDELTTAIRKQQKGNYSIWLLCLDDTRIVHPQARNLSHFKAKTREELEGQIYRLLNKLIE